MGKEWTREEVERLVPEEDVQIGLIECISAHTPLAGRLLLQTRLDLETAKGLIKDQSHIIDKRDAEITRLCSALERIRDREWIEHTLDPQWSTQIAREALKEKP